MAKERALTLEALRVMDAIDRRGSFPALKSLVVAGILQLRQAAQDRSLIDNHADRQMQHHLQI